MRKPLDISIYWSEGDRRVLYAWRTAPAGHDAGIVAFSGHGRVVCPHIYTGMPCPDCILAALDALGHSLVRDAKRACESLPLF